MRHTTDVQSSRLSQIAVILGFCVFATLAFALFFNDVDEVARPTATPVADPAVTPTPTTPRQTPPAAVTPTAAPTPIAIPDSAQALRLLRAGETCIVFEPETDRAVAAFVVPSSMVTANCRSLSWATDPESADRTLFVGYEAASGLSSHFDAAPEVWREMRTAEYLPTDGSPAWRLLYDLRNGDQAQELTHLIGVPGAGADVAGPERPGLISVTAGSPDDAEVVERLDALVASVQLLNPPEFGVPAPGGFCSGDDWVLDVPATWFSTENCRSVNSSSEDRIALQCECVGPIRVSELERSEPLPNAQDRGDGLRFVIEDQGIDEDTGIALSRTVTIEMPSTSLIIEANSQPDHALIGHRWEDTLAAQEVMVASVRRHSVGCVDEGGASFRVVEASSEGAFLHRQPEVDASTSSRMLARSRVTTTGCAEGDWAEVRLDADTSQIGWVQSLNLEPVVEAECPAGGYVAEDGDVVQVGDFDGDGLDEVASLRVVEETDNPDGSAGASSIKLTVPFANGSVASGVVDGVVGRFLPPPATSQLRLVGLDRAVVRIAVQVPGEGERVFFVAVDDCKPKVIGSARTQLSSLLSFGPCHASTIYGDIVRAIELEPAGTSGPERFESRVSSDQHLIFDGNELVEVEDWQWAVLGVEAPVCGPEYVPLTAPSDQTEPGTASGLYDLTVAFGDGESSFARFELVPTDSGDYRVDLGASLGRRISMTGLMSDARGDTLELAGQLALNAAGRVCKVGGRPSWLPLVTEDGWALSAPECDAELRLTPRVDPIFADPCDAGPLDLSEAWTHSLNVDVDADGRDDVVKVRPGREIVDYDITSVELAVVLDDGPVRRVELAAEEASMWVDDDGGGLKVVRVIGLDRDLVLLTNIFGAFSTSYVVDVATCEPKVLARLQSGARGIGWCRVDTDEGVLLRSYDLIGGSDEHLVWGGNGLVDALPDGFDDPACGPVLGG